MYSPEEFQQMIDLRKAGELKNYNLANYMKYLEGKSYELAEQLLRINFDKDEFYRIRAMATNQRALYRKKNL